MPRHYEPVAFLLAKPARVFTLAADPEIAPLLAAYGYDAAARAADQTAAQDAAAAVAVQEQATGAAQRATVQLQAAEAAARQTYQAFAALCKRVALRGDDAAQRALGLHLPTPRARDAFLVQARTAYQNAAAPDVQPRLAAHGHDAARLQTALAGLDAVQAAQRAREEAFGAQQRATVAQNAALADLETRYKKLLALVDLALAGHPQLREKLGLLEK